MCLFALGKTRRWDEKGYGMGMGILMCGLNGAGKSTLGKAVAKKLNFYFLDSEELYFAKADNGFVYASPRSHEEAMEHLFSEIRAHENFVLASVKGDYGEAIYPFFQYAVLIDVPKDIRIQRVKNRSFQKFGKSMLRGGNLYQREKLFLEFVQSRAEDAVEKWVRSLACPVIRVDGTKPVEENINFIVAQIQMEQAHANCDLPARL